MDLKSIVRVFRYSQLQSKADRDPELRRPPTIKFLALALVIGVVLLFLSFWNGPRVETETNGVSSLEVPSNTTSTTNETATPTPTTASQPLVVSGTQASWFVRD